MRCTMPTNNYFKVIKHTTIIGTYYFDDRNIDSIADAWLRACVKRDEAPPTVRRVAVYRPVALAGPWAGVTATFLSGLQPAYLSEYL